MRYQSWHQVLLEQLHIRVHLDAPDTKAITASYDVLGRA
jgi:hypothetical protein